MRLFVALEIPDDVRASLAALVAKLRPACRSARWARLEGLHVTLKFIGEVAAEKLEAIKSALASLPPREPFALKFRGLGFFPSALRPRVLWAGIEAPPALGELAAEIEKSFVPLGIEPETRAFAPHLTLARFESPRGLDPLHAAIEKARAVEFGDTVARDFHLYQSVLKRGGAEYTRLATFSFAGRASE